jgi:enoyl-[acyl-carrier protein] reductase II
MMKTTKLCHLLGIEHPVLQGGMLWLADANLAAAVSNAGALGVVSPLAGMGKREDPAENLKKQISRVKKLTREPFGVNLPLDLPYIGALVDVVLSAGVKIVITAAGNPADYSALFKTQGFTLLHVVSNVRQARIAESCGADAVIAEGVEAAAHIGSDELPLFSLVPQVADAVAIPVVAAGGIVDSRGLVAAIALGAQGVQLGTRFVAVKENLAHPNYINAILTANDADTIITGRKLIPARSLKTEFSRRLRELEKSGAGPRELSAFIGYRSNHEAQVIGNLDRGEAYCGASAGLVKEILPAAKVVRQLVQGYHKILENLS